MSTVFTQEARYGSGSAVEPVEATMGGAPMKRRAFAKAVVEVGPSRWGYPTAAYPPASREEEMFAEARQRRLPKGKPFAG